MTAGGIRRRCRCRDENRKDLGAKCPKLAQRSHGVWQLRHELPPDARGKRRTFRREGYETKKLAEKDLDRVHDLLGLAEDDEDRETVAALLDGLGPKEPLPEPEEIRGQLRAGTPLNSKVIMSEHFDWWLPMKKKNVRRATYVLYEGHVRNYLRPKLGTRRRDRLQVDHVTEMFARIEDDNEAIRANNADRAALEQQAKATGNRAQKRALREQLAQLPPYRRPVGKSSQQRILGTLRKSLNDAITAQLITFNPAKHVSISAKRARPLVWTPERIAKWKETGLRPGPVMVWLPEHAGAFLDYVAVEAPEQESMWHVMIYRGPRRGETAGLGWTEVYDEAGEIEINTQLTEVEYDVEEGDPKSDASTRRVPIDDDGIRLLREHRARQRRERLRVGPAWVDSGRVWTRPDGSALRPSWIGDEFERHCKAAGLPPIRLHDLRHVAATLMLSAGIDLKVVQETLGHSSWVVTRDTYTSVLPELARSAAEATVAIVPRRKTTGHPTGTPEAVVTSSGTRAIGR
ncbi:tyrosine-type recombinase/integrase [Amycolatopsis japonica]